jgi:phosphatidylserine/phosphatidylglycerophosphate/cardiolipin synthase-like enzyme
MFPKKRFVFILPLVLGLCAFIPQTARAQERLCDPSFENCYSPLLDLVQKETSSIDIAFYMIQLPELADALIARHRAGVAVRIIVEPRANLKFPGNQPLLDKFIAAGIPMRYKLGDGILHVKEMVLSGQNKVVFSGSNFGEADVAPYVPYQNYVLHGRSSRR